MITGQLTICLSGLPPEFLSWPLLDFTLQNGSKIPQKCENLGIGSHQMRASKPRVRLRRRGKRAETGISDPGYSGENP
jgi:hypothetical protein